MEDKGRITLDNPALAGKVRSYGRNRAYVRPPITRRSLKPVRPSKIVRDVDPAAVSLKIPTDKQITHKDIHKYTSVVPSKLSKPLNANHPKPGKRISVSRTTTQTENLTKTTQNFQGYSPKGLGGERQQTPDRSSTQLGSKRLKNNTKKASKMSVVLYAMASIVFVFGMTVSVKNLLTNHKADATVKQVKNSSGSHDNKGNNTPPSSEKPSSSFVANYKVAPNMPKYIDIPVLGVNAVVLPMSVDSTNKLEAPDNIYNAGWYNGSSLPGEQGAMLAEAHSGVGDIPGIFHDIDKLTAGSLIKITRGDDKVFIYKVVKQKTYDINNVDMASMMVSQDPNKPGLNLISCIGEVAPGTTDYSHRIIVYAVLQ